MSRLRADTLTDRTGTSAPDLTHGATSTTGTFSGDLGGGDVTLSGNASVDGTLTYQDADNINSTGIITAREGIQVSANGFDVTGISTFNSPITVAGITTINDSGLHATGVVTATSFAGDGSALTGTNRTISGIASGTLANGQTVIIHSDGKVGFVTETALSTPTVSDPVVFEAANTTYSDVGYDSGNGKVVVAYKDGGNSNYGTAIVGTVSGSSISFGAPVIFEYGATAYPSVAYDSTNEKIVIAFQDDNDFDRSKAIVGTVSGTSISFGSAALVDSAITDQREQVAVYDSANNRVVVVYSDLTNSLGKAAVGTVSGTSISFGTPVNFFSGEAQYIASVYDPDEEKIVIAFRQAASPYRGKAIVGTVSGTSISFGTAADFETGGTKQVGMTYDTTNNKVVIGYMDDDDNDYGKAIVGTVSGTSISFGTPVVFEDAGTYRCHLAYNAAANKVVIGYADNGNSLNGTVITGTVVGTAITFGTAVVFNSNGNTDHIGVTYDSVNKRAVTVFRNRGNSNNYGNAVVVNNSGTNLTTENFIGFSDAAYTNGQTATVQIITALDDAQSGLTTGSKHYVQNDGTLSTTAGSPSVLAGTAISDTEIIVKQ